MSPRGRADVGDGVRPGEASASAQSWPRSEEVLTLSLQIDTLQGGAGGHGVLILECDDSPSSRDLKDGAALGVA